MQLNYLGHSTFLLETAQHRVLIDPFLEGPTSPVTPAEALSWPLDAVLISHAHGDHWGNALDFGRRGVPIIATAEIGDYAQAHGAEQAIGANIGGTVRDEWGSVTFTPAFHSSSFPDGTYGGMPCGLIVEMDGVTLYHAGDTCAFSDMALIGERGLDAALLPVGDHFTMGPAEAARCLDWLKPRVAVPMHYGTFPPLVGDPQEFARLGRDKGVDVQVLNPGAALTLTAGGR
ncbi:metal-dependent hydrolase [Deinococcus sp. Marseille-Q6407]|uniref:metal-dependent hydrolase n=1 Tax=Deinococcus sp. Marseille-Q6407 TaxID=2969223 RepID=UPI0021BF79A4|nr:metal-dependent hydrolase [Deinococcus sp. Marseille-Q6407]